MSFAYQKVDYGDLTLENWKEYLDPTELYTFESELGDYEWHVVLENDKVIAIFQIIDVLKQYSKNLKINFHPAFELAQHDAAKIIVFIYESMLKVCDEKGIKKLKLYINHSYINDIFKQIVAHEDENNNIIGTKSYKKWIEIQMH